jgi:hypothetical protein
MGYIDGRLEKNGQGIIVPIEPKMRPISEGLEYGETPLPNVGHSTIDLWKDYYVPHVVLFVVEDHSTEL